MCGNRLRALARFCDACGALIGPGHPAGERKQITVLFADVVESMRLATRVDSERLREIMTNLLNRSAAVVQRYQGTVDKFTGDGLMALFGAPIALEDHALRACIAALEIQSSAQELAEEVLSRDDVELRIRIGLNSGEVIAGDVGTGPGSYTAVGHPVGMAQRMESAAWPGTVLCAESTARHVSHSAVFGPVQRVAVKGADEPVMARVLEAVESDRPALGRDASPFLGRDAELAELLDASSGGQVTITGVMGEAGVGKSRFIREFATAVGADPIVARCESHTANVPLYALVRLLRAIFSLRGLDRTAARARITDELSNVDPHPGDREVLFDLLSIGEPNKMVATMTTDARRHQLVEMMRRIAESRPKRMLFIVDDVHWIDPASEEVLARFAEALASTASMFVSGFRPEYQGPLRRMSQTTIILAPLNAYAATALATELIGRHPTVEGLAGRIVVPSAGNPFFVEEIVRDLVGRGLLAGQHSDYRLVGSLNAITVPPTVHAVLAARIDRLAADEKFILNAAAVIGSSFGLDLLSSLLPDIDADRLRGLLSAELIDQTAHLPIPRYMFRHPLVHAVAYDSQLLATRADSHRRLAAAIQTRDPAAVEQNSALIAQHLEAAGDLKESHRWYMLSADWLAQRDIRGARDCWGRAQVVADTMPAGNAGVTDMRIAPRAQLALTEWIVGGRAESQRIVDELRLLTAQSGDLLPLALALAGRLTSMILHEGRVRDAVVMAAELKNLYDRIDNSTATQRAELLMAVAFAQYSAGDLSESLMTTERLLVIGRELTVHDVAPAMAMAGAIKSMSGRVMEGRRDLTDARRLCRELGDALTFSIVMGYQIDPVLLGIEVVDDALLHQTRDAVGMAKSFGDAYGLALARYAHGMALIRSNDPRREEGVRLLKLSRVDGMDIGGSNLDADIAVELIRQGESVDVRLATLLDTVKDEMNNGDVVFVGQSVATLVQILVQRHAAGDLDQAHQIVAELAVAMAHCSEPALELWPLQCRAVLADAAGDQRAFRIAVAEYRDLARRLVAAGHLAAADAIAQR